jgi:serine/threonine protein kinase
VIHRDLKPENIMIGAFGEVIVLDWGAALVAAGRQETGVVVGTSRYMAPEQRRGEQVDCRADIYAIGVLLAQILPSDPPRPLAAIAAKACSPEPEVRYSTADEMAGDVRRYQDGLRVSAYAEGPWEAAARFAVRNRVLLLLLVTYGLVRFMLFFLRPS